LREVQEKGDHEGPEEDNHEKQEAGTEGQMPQVWHHGFQNRSLIGHMSPAFGPALSPNNSFHVFLWIV